MTRLFGTLLFSWAWGFAAVAAGAQGTESRPPAMAPPEALVETTIGMRVRIEELPLAGSKLRPKAVADPQKADVILRVLNVFRHGSGFRYNLEITPFVAGRIDLRAHLEREDGSPVSDLPELLVLATAARPAAQVEPNALDPIDTPRVGGYRVWQIACGVLWVLGLVAIVFVGRRRRGALDLAVAAGPPTLADRLRPLVESARAGSLDESGRAELERVLLAYWRRRRGLEQVKVSEAIATLRQDPDAGVLLLQLEQWLHAPGRGGAVDVAELLEPYRDVPDLEAGVSQDGAAP